jgi:hypothetical protein
LKPDRSYHAVSVAVAILLVGFCIALIALVPYLIAMATRVLR